MQTYHTEETACQSLQRWGKMPQTALNVHGHTVSLLTDREPELRHWAVTASFPSQKSFPLHCFFFFFKKITGIFVSCRFEIMGMCGPKPCFYPASLFLLSKHKHLMLLKTLLFTFKGSLLFSRVSVSRAQKSKPCLCIIHQVKLRQGSFLVILWKQLGFSVHFSVITKTYYYIYFCASLEFWYILIMVSLLENHKVEFNINWQG